MRPFNKYLAAICSVSFHHTETENAMPLFSVRCQLILHAEHRKFPSILATSFRFGSAPSLLFSCLFHSAWQATASTKNTHNKPWHKTHPPKGTRGSACTFWLSSRAWLQVRWFGWSVLPPLQHEMVGMGTLVSGLNPSSISFQNSGLSTAHVPWLATKGQNFHCQRGAPGQEQKCKGTF